MFYPWAFTGVCGSELHAMQAELDGLAGDDVELLTVSTDSMFVLRAFADQEGFTFPMLADFWPHGAVAVGAPTACCTPRSASLCGGPSSSTPTVSCAGRS